MIKFGSLFLVGVVKCSQGTLDNLVSDRCLDCDWLHFVKTSVLARCWTRCLDMLVRHRSVHCFTFLKDLVLSVRSLKIL